MCETHRTLYVQYIIYNIYEDPDLDGLYHFVMNELYSKHVMLCLMATRVKQDEGPKGLRD